VIWFAKKTEADRFNEYVVEQAEKWLVQIYVSFGSKPKNARKISSGMLGQLELYLSTHHPNNVRPGYLPAYEILILFVLRQHLIHGNSLAIPGEDPSFFIEESRAKGKKIISLIEEKLPSPAYDEYNVGLLNLLKESF